jgi:hypothetical protein
MEWMLYVAAALFCLAGAACVAMVVIQLPGTWVLLALAGLLEWVDRLWLPAGDRQTFGWWTLGGCLALAVAGEIIEFIAGMLGAKRGGSSRRGMIGALVGGIAGIFVFAPLFFFVPFLGAFLGAVLGTFVGALIGELSAERRTLGTSMKPAIAATIGRVIGTTSKIGIAMAMWGALSVAAFWR